jgi:fibronectin type 3 domain-containing protein
MHWHRSRRRRPLPRVGSTRCLPRLEELESRLAPSADVLTYHNDNSDTGQYLGETVLSPANVNVADFGKLFSTSVDGRVYAEPLYKSAVNILTGPSQGIHNVVYVATEHDSLYAIDADNGQVLWQDSFINPAAGITPVPTSDVGGSISPELGITSTPVIDASSNTLFLITYTKAVVGAANHYRYQIHAIDLSSGKEQFGGPLLFADTIFDGTNYTYVSGPVVNGTAPDSVGGKVFFNVPRQLQRPALTLVNGTIYAAFGSNGDITPSHGWILGFDTADAQHNLRLAAAFNTTPNGGLGTIWQSGGRIAVDASGNLYVMTGNGTFDTTLDANGFPVNGDYGDTILKLVADPGSSPTNQNKNGWGLKVVDYFTPHDTVNLEMLDLDLGSGAPLLLPDSAGSASHPHLLLGGGKAGTLYLIDRDNMGKFDPAADHVVQELPNLYAKGFWGPQAYYNGTLYFAGYSPTNSSALTYSISNATLSARPMSLSPDLVGFEGAVPTISANGASNGIVWYLDIGSGELRAYDATSFAGELYTSSQAPGGRDSLGFAVRFTTPTIANGRVYAGTTNALVAYGILGDHTVPPVPPSGLTATAVSSTQAKLTWADNSDNEDGFEIQLSLDGANFATVGTANVNDTSFFLNGLQPGQGYTFRIRAFNGAGASSFSTPASLTAPYGPITLLQFHLDGGFAQAASFVTLNGSAKINGSMLELTDGAANEAGSAFFNRPVDAANFTTKFSFKLLNAAADGFTFTIQGVGQNALGAAGSGLGYMGISASAAVKFDLFNSAGEGPDSTGLYTDGAVPTSGGSIDLTPTGLDLHSGDVFNVVLSYDGAMLRSIITDTNTDASATQAYAVDIPALIGGSPAFVGFTGSDGKLTATQNILNWSYTAPSITVLPPQNLTAVASNGKVALQWNASAGAASYSVFRSTSPGSEGITPYATGLTTNAFIDAETTGGSTYYYQVAAVNFGGASFKSNEASTTILPAPPGGATAAAAGRGIDLSWSASNGAASYNLYRATSPGDEGSTPYQTGLIGTSFNDPALPSGATFYFQVTAVNVAGESGKSNETSATLIPATPTGVTAHDGLGQLALNWATSSGATSYNVYRAMSSGAEGSTPYKTGLTSTSLTDRGLANGASYFYQVTAVNAGGQSSTSIEVVGTTIAVPPTGLQAAASGTQITLTWAPSAGAIAYNIYRSTTANGEGGTPYKTGLTGTTYTDLGLPSGATFYYQVTAVDAAGESANSNEISATLVPAAPTGVMAQGGFGEVAMSWSASFGATSYNVYRSTSSAGEGSTPYKTGLSGAAFTDTGLARGVTYFYQVTALNAGGESKKSNEGSGTTAAAPPLGLAGSATGTSISLTWSASNGAASYNVYRATSPGGEGSTAYRTGLTGTSFTDAALPSGATFYYQVTAVDAGGESRKSDESSATLVPAAPAGVTAQGGFGQVLLSWSAVSGAISYNVYRATSSGAEGSTPFMTGLTSTSLTDLGLASGASYFYQVTAVNAGGESSTSGEVVGTTIAAPPTGLQAAASGTQITLTWAPSAGAMAYNVYRSRSPGGEGSTPYKTGLTGTTFTDLGLPSGATFYYQVTAVDLGGESGKSNEASATLIPAAPIAVTAQGGFGQVVLSWAPSSGATSYNVYRATSSGAEGSTPVMTGLTSTSFADTGLASGVTYFYQVTALDAGGESNKSSEASGTTAATPPLGLAASAVGTQISLSWSPSNGATSYNIYRSMSPGGGGSTPYQVGLTGTSFTDVALPSGATFYYQVTAVDAGGESGKSNETSATLIPIPPAGVTAQGGPGRVILSWAASSGATSYNVYRATSSEAEGSTPFITGLTSTSLTDLGLPRGASYFYEVTAVNAGGESRVSSEAVGTTTAVPPSGLQAATSGTQITLTWTPSAGATAYDVYRSTTSHGEGSQPYKTAVAGTTFTDLALTGGVAYFYQVTAVDAGGESGKSLEASATLIPAAPAGVAALGGFGQVVLNWSASSGATSYNVYRSTSSGTEGSTPYKTGLTSTSLTDIGLARGVTYFYQVTALDAGGESDKSNEGSAITAAVPPLGLSASVAGTQISLSWSLSNGAASYNVYRATSSGAEGSTPYQSGLTATSFTDPRVANGTTYFYQVTAVNAGGQSGKSSQASVTLVPAAPVQVTVQGGFGQAVLSWSASSGATRYNVYRGTSSGAEGSTPFMAGLTSTSFTDTGLASGVTYFYQVTALDAGGESDKSREGSGVTAAAPPLGLTATVAGAHISLNWSASVGATRYNVYRATSSHGEGNSPYQSGLTATSFTDLGVANGTTYFYQVTAADPAGESGKSNEASSTSLSAAPATLTAQGGFGQVNLGWSASFGATSYDVFRATTSGGEGSTPYRTAMTGTALTDLAVASGATYFYQVRAVNNGGAGVRSHEVAGTVIAIPPTGFKVTALGASVVLTWAPSAGATSYNVYRAIRSRGEGNVPYKTGLKGTSLTDDTAVSGATYFYQVTAVNASGQSGKSSQASVTLVPAVPTRVTAQGGFSKVVLSWTASSGATSYNVYRATSRGTESSTPYKTGLAGTSFTDTGLTSGAGFFYKVSSVNAGGESGRSGEASATTIALPPAALTVAAAATRVALTWSPSAGAASYNVYRAITSRGEGATPYRIGITGLSFTDLGVASGASYFYQITAVNSGGESGKSPQASITLAPPSPQGVTSSVAAGQISLTWQASAGATSYDVYRGPASQAEGNTPYRTGVTGTSFTDAALPSGITFFYRVTAVNAAGLSSLSNEVVGTVPLLDLSTGFSGAGSLLTLNGSAKINGAFLQLTDGGPSEAASAFTSNRLDVTNFNTQFSFQIQNATADGFTFTIQGVGPTALGGGGAQLGYGAAAAPGPAGITNSVAIKFDIYNNAGEGNDSTGLYTNGASPTIPAIDLTPTGIDLHSGDIFTVTMNYGGGVLKVGITDTFTGASATQFYPINIPGIVGSSTAFIGFTGASGSLTAIQEILSWTYSPPILPPPIPIGVGVHPGAGTALIAWTASAGATSYNLYRSTSPGGEGPTPYQVGIASHSFIDSGLAAGVTFYYQVTAVDFAGESGRSAEVTAPVHLAAQINVLNNTTPMPAAYATDIALADEPHDGLTSMQALPNPNVSWDIAVPDGVLSNNDPAAIVVGQVFNLPSITRQIGKPVGKPAS